MTENASDSDTPTRRGPRRLLLHPLQVRDRRLVGQTVGTAVLNGATLAFNFVIVLLLSRLLGPAEYGAYAFAIAWALFLAVPAMLGLSILIVREVATYRVREDWSRAQGLLRRANQAVLAASLLLSSAAAILFWILDWPEPGLFRPTLVGLALVPLLALVAVRQSAMQGLGNVVLARVPEAIVAPLLTVAFVLALELSVAQGLSATSATGAHVAAAAFAAVLGGFLLKQMLPTAMRGADAVHETRIWLVGALPLLIASGIQAASVQAGTILTGSFAGEEEAGVYNVAARVAFLLSFLLLAVRPGLMLAVAELSERGESAALQRLVTRASRTVFLVSLPLALGTFVFAGPVLGLFGAGFGEGVTSLRILCVGQFVQLATGVAGMTLNMIGEAGRATWAVAVGAVLNLLLSFGLTPVFGAEGAAASMTTSIAVMNGLMVFFLWRRGRICATPLRLSSSL